MTTHDTGFTVEIVTPADMAEIVVDGRRFGSYVLLDDAPETAGCHGHSLDEIVGYVVFDNDVAPNGVTRTDLHVYVGSTSYGAAIELARRNVSRFDRGVGTLYRCGHRSY